MSKSNSRKYRFTVVDGVLCFETRYYAQKYITEVLDINTSDLEDNLSDKVFYEILNFNDYYCILAGKLL